MYLAMMMLPLLGSMVSGFFGSKVGVRGSHIMTCTLLMITTVLSVLSFIEVGLNATPVNMQVFKWMDSESLNVSWSFNFDALTVSMLIPVLMVSCLVHMYSIGYMSHDPHNQSFFSYLSLFTFMMMVLVTSDSYLLMFVGWEGVGVCSYLLVSFWFTSMAANQSSISAFLTNSVGDCFLTMGMFALLWSCGNVDYSTVFSTTPIMANNIVLMIGMCLLMGAMAKSSQIGLHVWLPMAMEGPTPVSALIHAATMVTAGVYLLLRSSPTMEYSTMVLLFCLWVGAITTMVSSLMGLFQQDMKKVMAYSTMSQLGMMVISMGLSSYNLALFHLVNHAFYKGLLFLGAGAVMHAVSDNQDFSKYGGLSAFLPLTYSVMLMASLSLVAFPFMTGFYSKDFMLESAYGQFYLSGITVYCISTMGAMFTTLYSVKVLYMTFLTNPNGPLKDYSHVHESDMFMSVPLMMLAFFSVFFGYTTKDIFMGLGSSFFSDNSLFIHPSHEMMLTTEFAVPVFFKILPLMLTLSLSAISMAFMEFIPKSLINFNLSSMGYNMYGFFSQRFLIELFYNKYMTNVVLKLGGQTTKVIDKGSMELIGPYGLESGLLSLSENMSKLSAPAITSYALYMLVSLIFYVLVFYSYSVDNNMVMMMVFGLLSVINSPVKSSDKSTGFFQSLKCFFMFLIVGASSSLRNFLSGSTVKQMMSLSMWYWFTVYLIALLMGTFYPDLLMSLVTRDMIICYMNSDDWNKWVEMSSAVINGLNDMEYKMHGFDNYVDSLYTNQDSKDKHMGPNEVKGIQDRQVGLYNGWTDLEKITRESDEFLMYIQQKYPTGTITSLQNADGNMKDPSENTYISKVISSMEVSPFEAKTSKVMTGS